MTEEEPHHGRSVVLQLDACCYCIPLHTGTKIIGFIELLICSVLFLMSLVEIIKVSSESGRESVSGEVEFLHFTSLIDVVFAIYLLIGVYMNKRHYAKIWCAAQAVHQLVSLLIAAYRIIFPLSNETTQWQVMLEFFIILVTDSYSILVVYSYYRSSKDSPPTRHYSIAPNTV